jgi:methyl-accepting chemotaxis protein
MYASWSVTSRVRIGGPVASELIAQKDLIADILPPPLFVVEAHLLAHQVLTASTPAEVDSCISRLERCRTLFEERREFWRQNLGNELNDAMYNQVIPPAEQFLTIATTDLLALIRADRRDEAHALVRGRLEELFIEHRQAVESAAQLATTMVEQTQRRAETEVASGMRTISVSAGIAVVLMIGFATWIGLSISSPLRQVLGAMRDLTQGNGDLRKRLELPPDTSEIGQLVSLFNSFLNNIHVIIKQVAESARQVAAASTQIAASSEQMSTGLKQQQGQTEQVSAAIAEMSASVVEVAKKSAEVATAAENSGKEARAGGEVVSQTVTEMKAIAEQVNESAASVAMLGKKSEQIGQIIGVINDIADQTNLLALNAAIEAARAGEHGRGFAVVADEVRKLAERTTQATKEVAVSIREIQGETTTAVERIEAGTSKVNTGVELAGNAGVALEKIVAGSTTLQSMVQSIAAAAEQQSAAGEQISRSVEAINAVTRESTEGAEQSAKAAAQLSAQAEVLGKYVAKFQI